MKAPVTELTELETMLLMVKAAGRRLGIGEHPMMRLGHLRLAPHLRIKNVALFPVVYLDGLKACQPNAYVTNPIAREFARTKAARELQDRSRAAIEKLYTDQTLIAPHAFMTLFGLTDQVYMRLLNAGLLCFENGCIKAAELREVSVWHPMRPG